MLRATQRPGVTARREPSARVAQDRWADPPAMPALGLDPLRVGRELPHLEDNVAVKVRRRTGHAVLDAVLGVGANRVGVRRRRGQSETAPPEVVRVQSRVPHQDR